MFSKKIMVEIEGMSCKHCAKSIEDNLKRIDNVKSVKVELENKRAIIKYKDNIDINEIKNKINELGYQFVGIKE